MSRKKHFEPERLLLVTIFMFLIPFVFAANDPGHDILYIEQQGDSELNGTLNVTENLSVQDIIFSGVDLDVRGDGVQASGSNNQIIGTSNALSIQSLGNIYINTLTGTTSTVFFGDGTPDNVSLNITGALFITGNNRLFITVGEAASSNLYWGDKLVCNASLSNCGWATGAAAGDVTGVYGDNIYIYNGSGIGEITLVLNETKLNATIDARATAAGDGNNYTTSASITNTSTKTLTIRRQGMSDLTTTFTDIDTNTGNCSVDQSCPNILYDSNASNFQTGTEIGNCSADQSCPLILYDTNATNFATTGNCAEGQYIQNISGTQVNCSTPPTTTDTDTWWTITGSLYLYNNSNVLTINETKLNNTIDARTGTGDGNITGGGLADRVAFYTGEGTISYDNNLTWNNTGKRLGIGTTTPESKLTLSGAGVQNTRIISTDYSDVGIILQRADYSTDAYTDWHIYDAGGNLKFDSLASSSENTRMAILNTGSVGIGTTSPSSLLHLNASSNQLRISFDDSNYGNISVNSGGNLTIKATGHVIIDLS